MKKTSENAQGVIIAGVGGQGAVTVSQLIMGAAWKAKYYTLQSEVHGMSQRGGAVSAHVLYDDSGEVTSPIVMEGAADILIGLEPLEALRYLSLLKKDAFIVVSTTPVKNMATYPDETQILSELKKVPGLKLIDTEKFAKDMNYRQAPNMILLGAASKHMPFSEALWKDTLAERFASKGDKVIAQNWEAFNLGRNL